MAKRHLAGMVRSSPNVVKFDSEPEEPRTWTRREEPWSPRWHFFSCNIVFWWEVLAPELLAIHAASPRAVQQCRGPK